MFGRSIVLTAALLLAAVPAGAQPGPPPLAGRVLDAAGAPVAGALVGLRVRPAYAQETVRRHVTPSLSPASSPYVGVFARTGRDGRFRLVVRDSAWRKPDARGMMDSVREVTVMAVGRKLMFQPVPEADTLVTLVAERAEWKTITWRVRDPSGRPVRGADVSLRAGPEAFSSARTDWKGHVRFSVPVGEQSSIRMVADGYRTVHVGMDAKRDTAVSGAEFVLRAPIRGVVRDERGAPVSGASVLLSLMGMGPVATADSLGQFLLDAPIRALPNGTMDDGYRTLLARSPDERQEGMASLTPVLASPRPVVAVSIAPRIPVQLRFPKGEWRGKDLSAYVLAHLRNPDGTILKTGLATGGMPKPDPADSTVLILYEMLPPGEYVVRRTEGFTVSDETPPFTVPSGVPAWTSPDMPVTLTALGKALGKTAVEVTARTPDGAPATLASLRGKVVVLDFWAYWCKPCVEKLPSLMKLQERYGDRIQVVALHDASLFTRSEYDAYYRQYVAPKLGGTPLSIPVWLDMPLPGDEHRPLDERRTGAGVSSRAYGVMSWPMTFVIDAQGRFIGMEDKTTTLDALVERALEGGGTPRRAADRRDPPPLSGRVLDAAGLPVANALVGLRVRSPSHRQTLQHHVTPHATVPTPQVGVFTRTDQHGRFRLALRDTAWQPGAAGMDSVREVTVMAEGKKLLFQRVPEPDTVVTLSLETAPWPALAWRLLDPARRPVAGAEVSLMAGPDVFLAATTDRTGRVRMAAPAADQNVLRIVASGYRRADVLLDPDPNRGEDTTTLVLRVPVRGVVRDVRGRPTPGAVLYFGTYPTPGAAPAMVADSLGRFVFAEPMRVVAEGEVRYEQKLLIARSPDQAQEAVASLVPLLPLARPALTMSMAPRIPVRLRFARGSWEGTSLSVLPVHRVRGGGRAPVNPFLSGVLVAKVDSADTTMLSATITLPPGDYSLQLRAGYAVNDTMPLRVPAGVAAWTTPALPVRLTALRRSFGKPALEVSARTLDGTLATLASLRGKVVVLDFWAWWCKGCIAKMPSLIALQERYGDRIQVVALHDASAMDRKEYDAYFQKYVAEKVGNKPLPVAVWLDRPEPGDAGKPSASRMGKGITSKAYQVSAWPTTYVIDARGRFLGIEEYGDGSLERLVRKALDEPPASGA